MVAGPVISCEVLCELCAERLVWHPGNGGQWLGADAPRDWGCCLGRPDGPRHLVTTPKPSWNLEAVMEWLDADGH